MVLMLIWTIFVTWPLSIINDLHDLSRSFDSFIIDKIFFHNDSNDKYHYFPPIRDLQCPWIFLIFIFIGIAMSLLFFTIKWYKFNKNNLINYNESNKFKKLGKFFLILLGIFISIPIFLVSFIFLSVWLTDILQQSFNQPKYNLNLTNCLYLLCIPSKYTSIIPDFSAPIPSEISHWNFCIGIFLSCFVVIFLIYTFFITFWKHFEILWLYLISFFVSSTTLFDESRSLFIWKEILFSKIVVSVYKVFLLFIYVFIFKFTYIHLINCNVFNNTNLEQYKRFIVLFIISLTSLVIWILDWKFTKNILREVKCYKLFMKDMTYLMQAIVFDLSTSNSFNIIRIFLNKIINNNLFRKYKVESWLLK